MHLKRWAVCEIEYRREGDASHPVTEELSSQGRVGERARALGALRLLRALGWPEACRSLDIEKIGDGVFLLKCKPACWRLFFHVVEAEGVIVLLQAVCKKKQKRKSRDADKAFRRLEDYKGKRATRSEVSL